MHQLLPREPWAFLPIHGSGESEDPSTGQESIVTEGVLFYFGFSSATFLLPTDTSLHDLVTPLLGLLALASRESQAGRGGLETRRE